MQGSVPAKRDRIRTMDLERAMEVMLEQQAKFQENLAEHDKRLEKAERLLIRGAEMLAISREANQETDRRITALVIAQQGNDQRLEANERRSQELHDSNLATQQSLRETQASLKAFIDAMRKSGDGQ